MKFTLDNLNDSIERLFGNGEHTVDALYGYLQDHPVFLPPPDEHSPYTVGLATLKDEGVDKDHRWFVFEIRDRHFKASTNENSSFGDVFYSAIEEVASTVVQTVEWKAIS